MYGQITNKKGEELYILTIVSSNEITPFIVVDTWAKCKERLEGMTEEKDNSAFLIQHYPDNTYKLKVDSCNHIHYQSDRGTNYIGYYSIPKKNYLWY